MKILKLRRIVRRIVRRTICWKLFNIINRLKYYNILKINRILREQTSENKRIKNINKNRGSLPLDESDFGY
jgi:hypothetical protein